MPFRCDFCGDPKVTQSYPAHTFDLTLRLKQSAFPHDEAAPQQESISGWAACDACHGLIQRGDETGLAMRSLNSFLENCPSMEDDAAGIYAGIVAIHNGFFANRTGEPTQRKREAI
jgi:hypothetical protein